MPFNNTPVPKISFPMASTQAASTTNTSSRPVAPRVPQQALISTTAGSAVSMPSVLQEEADPIVLTNLPPELLVIMMQQLDTATDILNLSLVSHQMQDIFQAAFPAHVRLCHILQHNMQLLHQQGMNKTAMPLPYTDAWRELKTYSLDLISDQAAYPKDLLKKIYITTWDLLLQLDMEKDVAVISSLKAILADISPYVTNLQRYVDNHHKFNDLTKFRATLDWSERGILLGENNGLLNEPRSTSLLLQQLRNSRHYNANITTSQSIGRNNHDKLTGTHTMPPQDFNMDTMSSILLPD